MIRCYWNAQVVRLIYYLGRQIFIRRYIDRWPRAFIHRTFQHKKADDSFAAAGIHLDHQIALCSAWHPAVPNLRLNIAWVFVFFVLFRKKIKDLPWIDLAID